MTKKAESQQYTVLREMLRERRQKAKLSQRQLAERLGKPQSWVCRHERGDLRMDLVELRAYLGALDVNLTTFVRTLDRKIAGLERE